MGVQFHHLKVDASSGKVEVALELVPTSKEVIGSDIIQGTTGQSRCGTSSSHVPAYDVADWVRPRLWTKAFG